MSDTDFIGPKNMLKTFVGRYTMDDKDLSHRIINHSDYGTLLEVQHDVSDALNSVNCCKYSTFYVLISWTGDERLALFVEVCKEIPFPYVLKDRVMVEFALFE